MGKNKEGKVKDKKNKINSKINTSKNTAIVLLTIDPTSPDQTVIGYSSNFESTVSPVGCSGAAVLGALFNAGFDIAEVEAGDAYVHYVLTNNKFSNKEQERHRAAFDNLNCEPIT